MLSKRLPRYMVPHSIVVVDQMPLTSHGKIDEAALAAIPVDDGPSAAPETETESALVAVLADLLDGVEIDVTAEFLSLGLDSIVALSVVQGARRRGIPLRARLMLECATIRELAAAIDSESVPVDRQGDGETGPIPVLPNVHWLYEHGQPRRLAQTEAIRLPDGITRAHLDRMLQAVVDGHEVLRSRLDIETMTLVEHDPQDILTEVWVEGDLADAVAEQSRKSVERLDPAAGFDAVRGVAARARRPGRARVDGTCTRVGPGVVADRAGRTRCGLAHHQVGPRPGARVGAHQLSALVASAHRARGRPRHL